MKQFYFLLLLLIAITPGQASEEVLDSDWLNTKQGSEGETIGARVESVDHQTLPNTTVLDISIPSSHLPYFDHVEVIDRENQQALPLKRQPQWIEEYEKDRHGLRLYLKKSPNLEFRLRLIDRE